MFKIDCLNDFIVEADVSAARHSDWTSHIFICANKSFGDLARTIVKAECREALVICYKMRDSIRDLISRIFGKIFDVYIEIETAACLGVGNLYSLLHTYFTYFTYFFHVNCKHILHLERLINFEKHFINKKNKNYIFLEVFFNK